MISKLVSLTKKTITSVILMNVCDDRVLSTSIVLVIKYFINSLLIQLHTFLHFSPLPFFFPNSSSYLFAYLQLKNTVIGLKLRRTNCLHIYQQISSSVDLKGSFRVRSKLSTCACHGACTDHEGEKRENAT
jgi:hypothetical protein